MKYFFRPDCGTITASLAEAAKTTRPSVAVCGGRSSVRRGVVLVLIRTRDGDGGTGLKRSPRLRWVVC